MVILILSEEEEEEDTRLEMGLTASANALTLFKTQGQDRYYYGY